MFRTCLGLLIFFFGLLFSFQAWGEEAASVSPRLPEGVPPVLGCWFWHGAEFEPDGYKVYVDLVSRHAPYNRLTTSLRIPLKEVTDEDVHDRIEEAAAYARERGVSVVMDLDVRLARKAFQDRYPDELQQMVILHEVPQRAGEETRIETKSRELTDHYTNRTTPYLSLEGSLLRVYSYRCGPAGIEPDTLEEITSSCGLIEASTQAVTVTVPPQKDTNDRYACAMVAFTHFCPDVFAPHLMEFQRDILRQYADAPLAGACKDEWGFPPCYDGNPKKDEYWYSRFEAQEYANRTGGRDLLADFLLMHRGIAGRERERISAINQFMKMSLERNSALESDFYQSVKETFGPKAMVATHPTWWPYPDLREFKKNGLDWWAAPRDWAQTDETTPFAVRTALAKKWGSPVWYDMYYSSKKADYERHVWTHALGGGRINYHPLYPREGTILENSASLLQGDLMRADCRVRLLNFISKSPLDCPVAVIFGHAGAMNWAGPAYNDVGMEIADAFWRAGYPADLIPSSEIENLGVTPEGWLHYGPQCYTAAVLYHPEFENPDTAEFLKKAAKGKTKVFQLGDWTRDFEGNPFDGNAALSESVTLLADNQAVLSKACKVLSEKEIVPQTPALARLEAFAEPSNCPPTEGFCRLLDGTLIWAAGTEKVSGDAFDITLEIEGKKVNVEAVGIAGVRLDEQGRLEALAAGELKHLGMEGFELDPDTPADIALWRDASGQYHGVIQGHDGPIPSALLEITSDWLRLALPEPLEDLPVEK
ncbi:MAG TPA: hypothetical protein PLG59_00445 [bacterium]|nr:hypothetical protein [bacterium]